MAEDTRHRFAERLRVELARHKMSQQALAGSIGSTQACVSRWSCATREPSITRLAQIADVFGVPTDYMLGRDDG